LKQIFGFFIIILLFVAFSARNIVCSDLTQVVVTIPELTSTDTQNCLEKEFNKLGGVKHCDTSLKTKTLILKLNEHEVGKNEIINVLQKWGCSFQNMSFSKLNLAPNKG